METTIRINTDLLTPEIMEGIKKMFPHKTVDIIIQSADDTEYILSNPAFANELAERIESYKSKKEVIFLKPEELLWEYLYETIYLFFCNSNNLINRGMHQA